MRSRPGARSTIWWASICLRLLWRKIGPSLSAGRVQSPALRLIVEREQEIEAFKSQEYWTVHLDSHKDKEKFTARLSQYRGEKVEQFTIVTDSQQAEIVEAIAKAARGTATVVRVEKKPKTRSPAAPFITSTLQQEAVRKLGMTADRAMRTAQQLYEGVDVGPGTVGLITYMRTDSTNLADEAVREIRDYVAKQFNATYLPKDPVVYRSKSKNAQEAHEAIRPTSIFRTPDDLKGHLTPDQARLYEMIWKRTLACQMAPARYDTTGLDIAVGGKDTLFRATGQTLVFPGYIAVYQEGADDSVDEGDEKLPAAAGGRADPGRPHLRRAALHAAAAALHRSEPGEEAGRVRHRQAVDLCQHHLDAAGARLCAAGQEALPARPIWGGWSTGS